MGDAPARRVSTFQEFGSPKQVDRHHRREGKPDRQTHAVGRSDFQGGAARLKKNANPSQSAPGRIAGTRLEPHTKEASSSGRE